jgi:predicted DNA-binding transcriptional regulator AlpA
MLVTARHMKKPVTPVVNTGAPRLLNERETAEFLRISRSSLRQARMSGLREKRIKSPPFIKIGRSVRYSLDDLISWLSSHRVDFNEKE